MDCRVGVISLGCVKNRVNTEQMMYLLRESGCEVTGDIDGAEAVVVNTCAFIQSAKDESLRTIKELGNLKRKGRIGSLIVTGCLPERYKRIIMEKIPEADAVLGTGSYGNIVKAVRETQGNSKRAAYFGDIDAPVSETPRVITTSKSWTYLKIAEGCDNRCSYCIIPAIRGRYRSRPMGNIIAEARDLSERGYKELILVAQDVSNYGSDLYGGRELGRLLTRMCNIPSVKWIRLMYLYPDAIDEGLIDIIAGQDKILKYMDIPIQHINEKILRKMNRRGSGEEIKALFERLRGRIPGLVLRTSVITGLPGEGIKEFEELKSFLLEQRIERVGVFPYSPEKGTPASSLQRADSKTAARRAEQIMDIQSQIMSDYNKSRIGHITPVLIEGKVTDLYPISFRDKVSLRGYYGRSYAEAPEADGYITVKGMNIKAGEITPVRITNINVCGEPIGIKKV